MLERCWPEKPVDLLVVGECGQVVVCAGHVLLSYSLLEVATCCTTTPVLTLQQYLQCFKLLSGD